MMPLTHNVQGVSCKPRARDAAEGERGPFVRGLAASRPRYAARRSIYPVRPRPRREAIGRSYSRNLSQFAQVEIQGGGHERLGIIGISKQADADAKRLRRGPADCGVKRQSEARVPVPLVGAADKDGRSLDASVLIGLCYRWSGPQAKPGVCRESSDTIKERPIANVVAGTEDADIAEDSPPKRKLAHRNVRRKTALYGQGLASNADT